MQYAHLTGIDKPISRIVQGTVFFSDNDLDAALALYDVIYESGCTTFDTAHAYGEGASERLLGKWINARRIRDRVVILDKGAHPYDGQQRVTPEHITSDIHESLERLGTDYIDLYLLHRDDPHQPVGPLVEVLNEHHAAGRIRAFGGSNWSHSRIQAANDYAQQHGLVPFRASSPHFSLAEMVNPPWEGCIGISGPKETAARDWYQEKHMPLFTWSSLAGGFMTGKFRRDNRHSFISEVEQTTIHAYAYDDNFKRLERAEKLAEDKGIPLPQLALAYVLNQPLNIFALVGSHNAAEFKMNLAALHTPLTAAELAWLNIEQERLST